MGMGADFKEFAMKGNVVDMAVGVVIGAAVAAYVAARRVTLAIASFVCIAAIGFVGQWDNAMDTLSRAPGTGWSTPTILEAILSPAHRSLRRR